jgi:GTP-binding protein HflX
VRAVLAEIDAAGVPELLVANKIDLAEPDAVATLVETGAVPVSAVTGEGREGLLEALTVRLRGLEAVVELVIPFDRGDVLAALHREGEVLVEVHVEEATRVQARLPRRVMSRFVEFVAEEPPAAEGQRAAR